MDNIITVNIKKPLYNNHVYINGSIVEKAISIGAKLEIIIPNGSAIVDPLEWKNNKEIRTGASFSYKIIPSVKLVGEIYRQTTNIENYYGEHSEDKNRMFYKLGINKTF